jgi:monodehydroascorbate reductase (NADH)
MGASSAKPARRDPSRRLAGESLASLSAIQATDTPDKTFRYVVLGFGTAAGYAAKELVTLNVSPGQTCIIGEEPALAYERPALSKAYLNPPGSKNRVRIPEFNTCVGSKGELQDADWYEGKGVSTMISSRVTEVSLMHKMMRVESFGNITTKANSSLVRYEKLLIATGASAARLGKVPGDELEGILYLRNEADFGDLVSKLEDPVVSKKRIVIIGGGYLGAEIASALTGWKIESIDMVFADSILMKHMPFPMPTKERLEQLVLERAKGRITIHRNVTVQNFKGMFGRLKSITLSNGTVLDTALCLVAIGAKPNTDIFKGKLNVSNGSLVTDEFLRTSHPSRDVWAVGDCSRADMGVEGVRKMAMYAAKCMYSSVKGKEENEPFQLTLKFHYSRLFEFMDNTKTIVFQMYGRVLSMHEVVEFVRSDTTFGCLWHEPKKSDTKAGFLVSFGADVERFNLLKDSVVVSRDVAESIQKLIADLV